MQGRGLVFHDGELAARLPAVISLPLAIVGMLAAIAVLVLLVRRARQHRAWAAEAREVMARATEHALRPGVHVIAGRVHTADGEPAIRIRIRESGKEWRAKNGMRHRWTEMHREVDARPFDLVTSGGTVRVEPDASVKLVDLLATVRRPSEHVREREASLDPGEHVYVSGLLRRMRGGDGAYRGGEAAQWVMRAPPDGALVCSTEPLSEPHERWARFHLRSAMIAALVAIPMIAFLGLGYFPLVLGGVVVEGRIVGLEHRVSRGRNTSHHYEVTAEATLPDGREIELFDELRRGAWQQLRHGDTLPFVVLPSHPSLHHVGRRPGLGDWTVGATFALTVVPSVAFVIARRRRRAWWEQEKVVTEGPGPLEDH